MNRKKHGNASLVTFKEFEQLLGIDRARRIRICNEHHVPVIDIGIDTRQPRISKQAIINLYNSCIEYKPKQKGKPRGYGDLQLVSFAEIINKFRIARSKLKLYIIKHNMRTLNISGSKRIPLCDIKLILDRQLVID